ncbi:hypothetical protein V8G54_001532 [Vigna mungo]|uniref:Uncharacterized protein n=1 Tax=Vigna mungo TaxID=3915 RepID=A0AAQ3PAK5_VIGMU
MDFSSKGFKRAAYKVGSASPTGWINDDNALTNFECFWRIQKIISHKYMGINFFKREGLFFQDWLEYQGLANFVEMSRDWYPNLVKKSELLKLAYVQGIQSRSTHY